MGGRAEAAERCGQAAVLGEALSGCPTLCPAPAAPTAGDGGRHSCFHLAREPKGKSIPGVAGRPSGRCPRAREQSGAHTPERKPNFALSSPQPPLCHNFAAADCPQPPADTHARLTARRSPTPRGQGRSPGAGSRGPGRRPRADARPVLAAPWPSPLQQLRSPALTP